MDEETKALLQEVKEGVIESVTPAVTKAVMDEVTAKMAEIKPVHADADEKAAQAKEATVELVKDMYSQLENGSKAVQKDLSTGSAGNGDELVPEYFNSEVKRVAQKYGVARRNARVVQMQGKEESWPTLGTVTVYRINEGAKITAMSPTTDGVKLTAKKLAAIIPMTRELVRDANINVVDQIAVLAGEAMAKAEDTWAFRGISSGEGIFQHADVPSHIMTAGKASYADADFADLLSMLDLIDEDALDNMKWYMSFAQFNAFRAIVSQADDRHIFQAPGAGMPPSIWNLPVEFTKVLPRPTDPNNTNQQSDKPFMTLANLDFLTLGERDGYELELSREATITSSDGNTVLNLWERDMVAVRVMERIDFVLHEADKAFANLFTSADLS